MSLLHVSKMAWILDHNGPGPLCFGRDLRQGIGVLFDEFMNVENTFAEGQGLWSAEQIPVLFHGCTAPGRVKQNRVGSREGCHRPTCERDGRWLVSGVMVKCSATGSALVRQGRTNSHCRQHVEDSLMYRSIPGIHHAAGMEPYVIACCDEWFLAKRKWWNAEL